MGIEVTASSSGHTLSLLLSLAFRQFIFHQLNTCWTWSYNRGENPPLYLFKFQCQLHIPTGIFSAWIRQKPPNIITCNFLTKKTIFSCKAFIYACLRYLYLSTKSVSPKFSSMSLNVDCRSSRTCLSTSRFAWICGEGQEKKRIQRTEICQYFVING